MKHAKTHACPVCAWPQLAEAPRPPGGGGSFEICPSCGFQFGVDDDDRGHTFAGWRRAWLKAGAPWRGTARRAPAGWDGAAQARKLAR